MAHLSTNGADSLSLDKLTRMTTVPMLVGKLTMSLSKRTQFVVELFIFLENKEYQIEVIVQRLTERY